MTGATANSRAEEVRALIEERLGLKGRSLDQALRRAGRLLPRRVRRSGAYLVQAERAMGHPKLSRMIDEAKVEEAHKSLVSHLKTIDRTERRTTRILGALGVVSFNLIVLAAALIGVLMWRGFL